jgi:peptidoglycan/LPS O-acetylase OafA/YrhL
MADVTPAGVAPAGVASARGATTRLLELDLLRGAAILLVLFAHAVHPRHAGILAPSLSYLRYLGPTGVDLFFVLSGFLVGGILFRELAETARIDLTRFWIRRAFRIWPSYFVFVAFIGLSLIFAKHYDAGRAFTAILPNLLHAQNYLGSPASHTWSLAVEEHFYLVLPALLVLLGARRTTAAVPLARLPIAALGLLVVCLLLRFEAYANPPSYKPHFATHLRVDALVFGVLLAYLHRFQPERLLFAARHPRIMLLFGLLLLLPFPALVSWDQRNMIVGSIGFTLVYLGYGSLLLGVMAASSAGGWLGRWSKGAGARALGYIGFHSYPIYLFHLEATRPAARVIRSRYLGALPLELGWLAGFAIYVSVAVGAGVVFSKLLERPTLALRDRLFPASHGAETPIQAPPSRDEQHDGRAPRS